MNILLIGSGGREHALAWKIRQSKQTEKLYIAPGNAGISGVGENIPVAVTDFPGIARACKDLAIGLLVIGPEGPLVDGLRDFVEQQPELKHVLIVGPGKEGAQLEGSKDFSKAFMERHGVPTARAKTFSASTLDAGLEYLNSRKLPVVLKADGLAAGKGVIISHDLNEAKAALREMLENKLFGDASKHVLVEDFLEGI
ncbi:MAG TPA: hypothetical protein VG737_00100, partial [Cyclobacteriaceae bacterium]|nr:hypothetical protein [Cyclobacteriaceae bacterium]